MGKNFRDARDKAKTEMQGPTGGSSSSGVRNANIADRNEGTGGAAPRSESPSTTAGLVHHAFFDDKGQPRIREIAFALVVFANGYVFQQDNQKGIGDFPALGFTLFKCVALSLVLLGVLILYKVFLDRGSPEGLIRFNRARVVLGFVVVTAIVAGGIGAGHQWGVNAQKAAEASKKVEDLHDAARAKAITAAAALYSSELDRAREDYRGRLKTAQAMYEEH